MESARSIGCKYTYLYNFKITSLKNDNILDSIRPLCIIQLKIVYIFTVCMHNTRYTSAYITYVIRPTLLQMYIIILSHYGGMNSSPHTHIEW